MSSDPASAAISGLFDLMGAGLTSGLGFISQSKSHKNQKELLALQQAWAERMANTAHQREVKDLRAAGLNPILSATGGNGAPVPVSSAPSSSSATIGDMSKLGSNMVDAMATAKNAKTAADAQKSQADLNKSQENLNRANAALASAKTAKELEIGKPLGKAGQLFDALSDPNTYKGVWENLKESFGGSSSAKSSGDKTQKLRNIFTDGQPYPYPEKTRGKIIGFPERGTSYGEYYYKGKWHKGTFQTPHK